MSKTLILKVLSGSQLGVEVGLADGEYSFGSGPDADIQFADLSMAPIHGQLRVAGGKVEIRATGAAIQTASGLVIAAGDGEWREIAQLDRITAGTSVFAVGGADANWTSLAAAPTQTTERRADSSHTARVNRNWLIGAGVVAACVVAVLLLTGGGPSLPIAARSTPDQDLQLVRETIGDLAFSNELDVTAEADGTITVSGYVETGTERRAVQNALQDLGIDVRRRIWALEALRTDVSGLIASQNIDVTFDLRPDGELVLSGVWLDGEAVTRTVGLLESEVFGLSRITDNVRVAEDFLTEVNNLLVKLQLNELVLARLDGMLIETTGVVPQDKLDNWAGFMRTYAGEIAQFMPLRSFVTLEGQPVDATVPVIVGAAEGEVATGRVLPTDTTEIETTDPSILFAQSGDAATTAPPAEGTVAEAASAAAPAPDPATAEELSAYEQLINDFAEQNPEVVGLLIRALTNGQFSDIEGLRAFFATSAPAEGGGAVPLVDGATLSSPEAIVSALNDQPGATETAAPVSASVAPFDPLAALAALNAALSTIYDTSGPEPQLTDSAQEMNPELAGVSKQLISLADAQTNALARGETLLEIPTPLEAERRTELSANRCWAESNITVESLTTVVLWMDILSLSSNLDIGQVRADSRLLFMEASLNPDRLRSCLRSAGGDFGAAVLESSEFLRETGRNDRFAAFLLRNIPRYPLEVAGVNLEGDRYVQLSDGRKLSEGAAPTVDSRLVAIGDLGLLIRVADGYRVNLYGDDLGWLLAEN